MPRRGGQQRSPEQVAQAGRQARQASVPFATEHTLNADVDAVGSAQEQLLRVNQTRDRVRAELERFGQGMGRTLSDRRRKAELEAQLLHLDSQASQFRSWLKQHEFA